MDILTDQRRWYIVESIGTIGCHFVCVLSVRRSFSERQKIRFNLINLKWPCPKIFHWVAKVVVVVKSFMLRAICFFDLILYTDIPAYAEFLSSIFFS